MANFICACILVTLCARAAAAAIATALVDTKCIERGAALCSADVDCAGFGVYNDEIQFHGCVDELVPNYQWAIFAHTNLSINGSAGYSRLNGYFNVDESKCAHHPKTQETSCGTNPPSPSPPPPSPPLLFEPLGSIDLGTFENSLFFWHGHMYVLENIGCTYADHAGQWDPSFAGTSYTRIRHLDTGAIVSNISATRSYAFVSSFPDYEHDRLWLFGIDFNRCKGTARGTRVEAFWNTKGGSDLTSWSSATAIAGLKTFNTEATKVEQVASGMPPHKYALIAEEFSFYLNNAQDGNLTRGWFQANSTVPQNAPFGGPSLRWSRGFYYAITGGRTVNLFRSPDLRTWTASPHNPAVRPTPNDAKIAPYANFAASAARKGFTTMENHWQSWDWNSNDGDVCCLAPGVNTSWWVYGASTQGRAPKPPVPRNQSACTNAIGRADIPLADLLERYFQP
eukprot:UC1_evm1s1892